MPAPKIYMNSADIAAVMGISTRSARNMLAMFDMQGKTVKSGQSSRGRLVSISIFVQYLCDQDGADPVQCKRDIIDCLREIGGGTKKGDIRKKATA